MKKVIISGYWTIAVLLISLVVLSLGYTFPESLFIAATFLPGAFFSLYFPERISRSGGVKDILYVVAGILVVEISLILSAHFVILEMRNDFNAGVDFFELPDILVNPVFILVVIAAFASGNFFLWKKLEQKYPDMEGKVTFVSERRKVTLCKNEIDYIESNDTQTFVVANTGCRYRNRTPISQWESLLGTSFVRIHRSYLVRKDAVKDVLADSVSLAGGSVLPVSRSYRDKTAQSFAQK